MTGAGTPPDPSGLATEGLKRLAGDASVRLRVRGSSMEPLLRDGMLVDVAARRVYWPGDILAFRSPDGQIVVHRLLGWALLRGRLRLITRGDRRSGIDPPTLPGTVIGRVVTGVGEDRGIRVPMAHRLAAAAGFGALALRRLLRRSGFNRSRERAPGRGRRD